MSSRLVSRVSTVEAARTVFFIVVGLAIKQSLGLFAHSWPSKDFPNAPTWPFWARAIIAAGYLVTVIRFSHGVTLLYGHEKERIENSSLPSATKISQLSLFLVLLAIPLFLMADNIIETNSYIFWTAIMVALDIVYILKSDVVRQPLRRIFRILRETDRGYAAHAAFWWMVTDSALFVACLLFFVRSSIGSTLAANPPARELLFAGVLIVGAVADYWLNWDFYFGGRHDRREQKFVFVTSRLRNEGLAIYKENINRAQLYCRNLMNWRSLFGKKITPLASHAFFPYFLNDGVREDRALGVECALAFLSACDAVYVYVPAVDRPLKTFFQRAKIKNLVESLKLTKALQEGWLNPLIERLDKNRLTPGMRYSVDAARTNGIEIRYLKEVAGLPPANTWPPPNWTSITYEREPPERKPSESYFKGAAQRKRVYVCTSFRGKGFDDKSWPEKIRQMQTASRLTLWHCHQLVRDPDEALAPFAPQAFFPYFWKFTLNNQIDPTAWEAWFERSIEILKVCDAVYIYTAEGLPPMPDDCSAGVIMVDQTARKLGLEVQYRKELTPPEDPSLAQRQEFGAAVRAAEQAISKARIAEAEADAITRTARSYRLRTGADSEMTQRARSAAWKAIRYADALRHFAEVAERDAAEKRTRLLKSTWNPAVPEF
jgi:hypothetical protein